MIATAPAELNVTLPKFVSLPASLPSVIVAPVMLALAVIAKSPSLPSVTDPDALTTRLAALTLPSSAIAPALLVTVAEVVAATVPVVRSPPPDWSICAEPPPVIRLVTFTAVASVLSTSTLPLVVSALIDVAANSRAVVLPIPVAAFRSTVAAVTSPAPLIEPAALLVTVT